MSESDRSRPFIEMDTLPAPLGRERSRGRSRSRMRESATRQDYVIGICLLLIVVVLWTSGNFVTQGLFEDGYEKPFLVTYLNTSAFALYLVPYAIRISLERRRSRLQRERSSGEESEPLVVNMDARETMLSLNNQASGDIPAAKDLSPLTVRETAELAVFFCLLWFIANWSVNASLDYTSVASATVLSSMSGFFTLGIGRLFRVESLTVLKFCTVVTSFGGVFLVSWSDSSEGRSTGPPAPSAPMAPSPSNPITTFALAQTFGDVLALLSALFYALYVILLKVRIKSESRIDMQLFFGFVGLFNILMCWPVGILLHFTGVERFELPYTSRTVVALLVNMGITLSSDYIYVLAMLKTTPLVVTIGLSLTMPLAVLGDFLLGKPAKMQVIVGAAVVLISFVLVGWEDSHNNEEEDLLIGGPLHQEQEEGGVRLEEEHIPD
ncbi:uncharacterized protein LAESUDRAFT_813148, partial [Laetiporus sulphureus 93-53]